MIPKFQYPITFLPCKNLDEINIFYTKILGLEIALEQGECVIFKIGHSPHTGYWGFCAHHSEFITPAKRVCLTLVVNTKMDVDRWHKNLTQNNILCTKIPMDTPLFKIYNAFYQDPMGYTIEIQAFYNDSKPKFTQYLSSKGKKK